MAKDSGQNGLRQQGLREHDLRQRLAHLERQILDLRRELRDEATDPLPSEPFGALEVRVVDTWYLVPITDIREVLQMLWPQPLPEAPDWVLGTFLYGNQSVPLVDLRARLHTVGKTAAGPPAAGSPAAGSPAAGSPADLDPTATVLVTSSRPPGAFVVDEIRDLMTIDPEHVAPPNPGISQAPFLAGAVRSRGEMHVHLLSVDRLCREAVGAVAYPPDGEAPRNRGEGGEPDVGGADDDG